MRRLSPVLLWTWLHQQQDGQPSRQLGTLQVKIAQSYTLLAAEGLANEHTCSDGSLKVALVSTKQEPQGPGLQACMKCKSPFTLDKWGSDVQNHCHDGE